MVTVSLCVCTRDRPADLERCLASVAAGSELPQAVIVSDDGRRSADSRAIVSSLGEPFVYVAGPRKGLSANRNNCVRSVTTSHLAFTDDDVVVPYDFVSSLVTAAGAAEDAIVTGWERKLDAGRAYVRISPHDADFWGLQRRIVRGSPRSIVINATVFPRGLFDRIRFDERLRYGSFVYVAGPRKGLSANRNNCIRFVTTSHLAFTDDDVVVPCDFVSSLVTAAGAAEDAIVTGWERKLHAGRAYVRITPHDADFWGFSARWCAARLDRSSSTPPSFREVSSTASGSTSDSATARRRSTLLNMRQP